MGSLLDMSKVLVLDVESTGMGSKDQVIELSYIGADHLPDLLTNPTMSFEQRYKPSVMINPHAFKVHNITMKDIFHKPSTHTLTLPYKVEYIIGANISFDIRLMSQSNTILQLGHIKLIDIQDLAKLVKKHHKIEFENVKLSYLYYFFHPEDKVNEKPYHSAMDDVVKTGAVLQKLLTYLPGLTTIEDIYQFIQATKKVKNV
jgi:DNA polymerase III epsilon subunit-like protein